MSPPVDGVRMVIERPRHPTRHNIRREPPIQWSTANLLLLLPLLALFTPFSNRLEPRLLGLPFFYWFPLAVLLLTIAVTVLVNALTRTDVEDDGRE